MTLKLEVNYYFCDKEGDPQHEWEYRGRRAQSYRCKVCGIVVTKAALKENTDA